MKKLLKVETPVGTVTRRTANEYRFVAVAIRPAMTCHLSTLPNHDHHLGQACRYCQNTGTIPAVVLDFWSRTERGATIPALRTGYEIIGTFPVPEPQS